MNPLDIYTPKNRLEHELKKNLRQNIAANAIEDSGSTTAVDYYINKQLISTTLTIKYEGPIDIGDRTVIERIIANPWEDILKEAELEDNNHYNVQCPSYWSKDFRTWYRENYPCSAILVPIELLCCPCLIRVMCAIEYNLYKEQFYKVRTERIYAKANIMLKEFYEKRIVDALKEADTLVNECIEFKKERSNMMLRFSQSQSGTSNYSTITASQPTPRSMSRQALSI